MKIRIFVAPLLLSFGLVFAAFGQSSSTNESIQPGQTTSSSDTDAEKAPLKSTSTDFWDGEEPSLGALITHPFASKAYVRRHVQPIRDRIAELDELTATHSKMIRDVDARAQQGIQLASAKTNIADQHAQEAATKAEGARQTAALADTRLDADEKIVANIDQYKSGAQTEIRFRPGQTVLSKEAKDALDEMAGQLKNQHGYIIEVQGFSSGQGNAGVANSRKMADSVVRYLVLNHDIPAYRIYVLGLGSTTASKSSGGTRVEVNLLKNDLAQVAKP